MKKLVFIFSMAVIALMSSCNNDDDYKDIYYSIGTLSVDSTGNIEYIYSDKANTINALNTPKTSLENGARAYVQFTDLENVSRADGNIYNANFIFVDDILTKNIIEINEMNADSIGHDNIDIRDVWFSEGYINFEFTFMGYAGTHMINLVGNSEVFSPNVEIAPDVVNLELKQNAFGDSEATLMNGLVSFKLNSLPFNVAKGQKFEVSYESIDGIVKSVSVSYDYGDTADVAKASGDFSRKIK
ncbi:MAG: hypothetical protein ACK5IQ_08705 [Bacteroidales bacterium]